MRVKLNLLLRRAVLRASQFFFCSFLVCLVFRQAFRSAAQGVQGAERWAHCLKPSAVCAQAGVFLGVLRPSRMSRECYTFLTCVFEFRCIDTDSCTSIPGPLQLRSAPDLSRSRADVAGAHSRRGSVAARGSDRPVPRTLCHVNRK